MAVWQFDVYVVPKAKLAAGAKGLVERISEHDFDSTAWWEVESLPAGYEEMLTGVLPRAASWVETVECWGEEDGNCITIAWSDRQVDEVRVRIDVRNLDELFIEKAVRVAARWKCAFVTEDLEVVSADTEALLKEVKNSSAYRYVLDPSSYFAGDDPE